MPKKIKNKIPNVESRKTPASGYPEKNPMNKSQAKLLPKNKKAVKQNPIK